MTLGRAWAAHRTELRLLVSASLAKSHPPAPGERIRLGLVQYAPAVGSFELPAMLLEVRIATKIFPGEARRVERLKFLIRARVRQSAWLIDVVSTGKLPISRPVGMISARAAAEYAPAAQRVLPWRQGMGSRLVWRAPAKKMPITVFGHPTGSGQVRVPGPSCAFGLVCRIDMEDDQPTSRQLAPSASASSRRRYVTRCCSS